MVNLVFQNFTTGVTYIAVSIHRHGTHVCPYSLWHPCATLKSPLGAVPSGPVADSGTQTPGKRKIAFNDILGPKSRWFYGLIIDNLWVFVVLVLFYFICTQVTYLHTSWQPSWLDIDGLVQDCSNSIANAPELLQSCTKPSICEFQKATCILQTLDRRNP